ncbi:hypothetical protein I552_3963 [Mycobacterium xenopi 3993]|nr:hypothetical protein I552_3963 [Mycobacterium xenopi 3993]
MLLLHPTRADVVGVGIVGVRQVLDVVGPPFGQVMSVPGGCAAAGRTRRPDLP